MASQVPPGVPVDREQALLSLCLSVTSSCLELFPAEVYTRQFWWTSCVWCLGWGELQIFGMAQQEMEYRVDLFNKWAAHTLHPSLCPTLGQMFSLVSVLLRFQFCQENRMQRNCVLLQASSHSALSMMITDQTWWEGAQAYSDVLRQVRWKKVSAHYSFCLEVFRFALKAVYISAWSLNAVSIRVLLRHEVNKQG